MTVGPKQACTARCDRGRARGGDRRRGLRRARPAPSSSSSASRSFRPRRSSRARVRRPLRHGLRRAPQRLLRALRRSRPTSRFYTLRIGVSTGAAPRSQIRRRDDAARRRPASRSRPRAVDPEGLALTKDDTLVRHLRGLRRAADRPLGARVRLDGRSSARCPSRRAFLPVAAARAACARTSASRAPATAPNGRFLFTGTRARSSRTARRRRSRPAARRGSSATTSRPEARPAVRLLDRPDRRAARARRPSSPSAGSSSCCR